MQKRADRANQSVLFFLAGANFWEKHAKNCAIMSMAHITYAKCGPPLHKGRQEVWGGDSGDWGEELRHGSLQKNEL